MNAYEIVEMCLDINARRNDITEWNPSARIDEINREMSPMWSVGEKTEGIVNWRVTSYTPVDELTIGSKAGLHVDGVPGIGIRDISRRVDLIECGSDCKRLRIVTGANADLGAESALLAMNQGVHVLAGCRKNRYQSMREKFSAQENWSPLILDEPESWFSTFLAIFTQPSVVEVVNAAAYHIMDDALFNEQRDVLDGREDDEALVERVQDFTFANTGLPMQLINVLAGYPMVKRVVWVDIGTTDTRGSTQVITTKLAAEKIVLDTCDANNKSLSYAAVQAGRIGTSAKALTQTTNSEIPVHLVAQLADACIVHASKYRYMRPEITMLSSGNYRSFSDKELSRRAL
ncbi:MAG: hypothetical protein QM784_09060 [Polyangiaceae bacterium]